jgi:pimeloyl-ACP methyl ester carboxylesterase
MASIYYYFRIKEGYIEGKYGKIFYRLQGPKDGDRVVCIHGIGSSNESWKYLSKHLASSTKKKFRVLTFDLYGRGNSSFTNEKQTADFFNEQIVEVIDKTHFMEHHTSFAMIGHSMGGAICLYFTSKYPEMVNALIALSPAGYLNLFLQQLKYFQDQMEIASWSISGKKFIFWAIHLSKIWSIN